MTSTRVADFIRSNLLGLIAIFIAIGGTAIALPGKGKIDKNDLRRNVVKSRHVAPNALTGADINEGRLVGLPGSIGRSGRSQGVCDPGPSAADCATVSVTLPRPSRVLLIGTASWRTKAFSGDDEAEGGCVLTEGGTTILDSLAPVGEKRGDLINEASWTDVGALEFPGAMATNGVTSVLDPGSHTFALRCTEVDPDMAFSYARISAVVLGSG